MFTSLGRFVTGHARAVLVGTLLLLVGAGFLGFGVFASSRTGASPTRPRSRAARPNSPRRPSTAASTW